MQATYTDKVIVITGGSSGIGLALAKEFAREQALVTLIARDIQKLLVAQKAVAEVAGASVDVVVADVSLKEEITTAVQQIGEKWGRIDLLINCAGGASCGRFRDVPNEELTRCMQVNYLGSVYASKAAWSYLKHSKGQLSFVSSVAGYVGLIGYSSYAPTKFAMGGLAECLRFEGKDDDIRVSIIYPPDTDTPLYQYESQHTLPECKALSKNIKLKSAEEVAKIYISGLKKNKFEIYCDTESKMVRWLKNNMPGLFVYATNAIINKARKNNFK